MTEMSGFENSAAPRIVWEEVACPLCKAHAEEPCLSVSGGPAQPTYRLVRCRSCGMGYLNPRPDFASIAQFYPEDYTPYSPRTEVKPGWWGRLSQRLERLVLRAYLNYPPPLRHWHERVLAALAAPWLAPARSSHTSVPYQGEGRLLDFGCGSGWLARRMMKRGWQVEGMDFSEYAARGVAERYGIPVHVGTLPHPAVGPESFDVINMGAVLEHVHWPHTLIEAAVKALRPGGFLVVSVPNFASWSVRTFGAASFIVDLPRHLLHFTPITLRRLLLAHGLEVNELRILGRVGWMRRTLTAPATGSGWKQRVLARLGSRQPGLGLLTRWTAWTGQADQLLAIAQRPARPVRYRVAS